MQSGAVVDISYVMLLLSVVAGMVMFRTCLAVMALTVEIRIDAGTGTGAAAGP